MYRYRIPFVIGLKNNCPNCPNCPPEILVIRKSARYPPSVTALQFQISPEILVVRKSARYPRSVTALQRYSSK